MKYFAKFLALLLHNTSFFLFTEYFTLHNLILLLHIYTKIAVFKTSFFKKIMEIYFITTSYYAQIYFIITSYMKYGWL